MTLKTIDEKGRLTVGRDFAGRTVQIETMDDGVYVKFYKAVPEREAWLHENTAAAAMLARGLQQARDGDLSQGPDIEAAFGFADSIPDD